MQGEKELSFEEGLELPSAALSDRLALTLYGILLHEFAVFPRLIGDGPIV